MFAFLLLLSSALAAPVTDLCEVLNLKNCGGVSRQSRRSSAQSLPSTSTASQFNPANVSHDRGVGAEVVYLPGATPTFSFVGGTGKAGAGLVSTNLESSFFSNRAIELDPDFLDRNEDNDPYTTKKQTLALGAGLLKSRNISWDVGGIVRYNSDTGRVNPGFGTNLRLWIFSAGISTYRDDQLLKFKSLVEPTSGVPYSALYGREDFHQQNNVQTYFLGARVGKLSLDAGQIHTRQSFLGDGPTNIRLYSASYIWGRWLFNLAHRHERSPHTKYRDGKLVYRDVANDLYGGVQYSLTKSIVLGVHHNYYLLRELAVSGAFFF